MKTINELIALELVFDIIFFNLKTNVWNCNQTRQVARLLAVVVIGKNQIK